MVVAEANFLGLSLLVYSYSDPSGPGWHLGELTQCPPQGQPVL